MQASPLMDAPRFASHFGQALRGMWAEWTGETPPAETTMPTTTPEADLHRALTHHQSGDLESHGRVDVMSDMTRFDADRLRQLIENHVKWTGSTRGAEILAKWESYAPKFRKVMPVEYRRALMEMQRAQQPMAAE